MGLSSKQVPGEQQGLGWSTETMMDLAKQPSPTRKNHLQYQQQQQKQKQPSEVLECPRCNSTNTKFCYYNNCQKSQPRHYCRSCKRHWTKGGTLRDVPVGGHRKHKRVKVSKTAATTTTTAIKMSYETVHKGDNNGVAYIFGPSHQQWSAAALSDQKSVSDTLFGTTNHTSSSLQNDAMNIFPGESFTVSNGDFSGSMLMPSQFSFSNTNSSSFTTPFQELNSYDQIVNFDVGLESTISTTCDVLSEPWQIPETSVDMDVINQWSWGDIDSMLSDDLEVPLWNENNA